MIHFALLLRPGGYSSGSWRIPGTQVERATDLGLYAELTLAAEKAGIDAVFMADAVTLYGDPNDHLAQPLEPITVLSALAALTTRIGLIATISTTYSEPYNVARQLASLDHISKGRAGWNVVTTAASDDAAKNYGKDHHLAHAIRYARADEYEEAVKQLWLSWRSDAIVVDREAGIQTRPGSINPIDYEGEYVRVRGPLNIPRSPQEWPLLVHAGQSADGLPIAAKHAEMLFSVQQNIDTAREFRLNLQERLVRAGRRRDGIKVLPGLVPVLGSTEAEARSRLAELDAAGAGQDRAQELSWVLGFDVTTVDPETPVDASTVKPPSTVNGPQSWYSQVYAMTQSESHTVGSLRARLERIGRSGHLQLVGTPEQVAAEIAQWYQTGAADGFVIQPPVVPADNDAFYDGVLPELEKRGVYSPEYQGTTLRENLELPALETAFPELAA